VYDKYLKSSPTWTRLVLVKYRAYDVMSELNNFEKKFEIATPTLKNRFFGGGTR
jgi:hypothetical protein